MRAVIPKADSFWTFLAEVACRQPSGLGERVRTERTTPGPHGVAQKNCGRRPVELFPMSGARVARLRPRASGSYPTDRRADALPEKKPRRSPFSNP